MTYPEYRFDVGQFVEFADSIRIEQLCCTSSLACTVCYDGVLLPWVFVSVRPFEVPVNVFGEDLANVGMC